MRILLSNDDGIHAAGLNVLAETLLTDHELTIIAPDRDRTSCGHGITLGEPVRIKEMGADRYSCTGKPADCVLIGLGHLMRGNSPDLVLSGINHGANLGQDRYYSGTIAAAREAAFRNIPAIATSLVTKSVREVEHFETAAKVIKHLINANIHKDLPPLSLININIPNLPWEELAGIELTELGFQEYTFDVEERLDTRGRKYFWLGGKYQGAQDIADTDGNCVRAGKVSVNLQTFEVWNMLTHEQKCSAKKQLADKLKLIGDEIF